jgi:hypothetical protein
LVDEADAEAVIVMGGFERGVTRRLGLVVVGGVGGVGVVVVLMVSSVLGSEWV